MKKIIQWVRSHSCLHRVLRTFLQTALGVLAGAVAEASGMLGEMDLEAVIVMAVATGLAAVMNLPGAEQTKEEEKNDGSESGGV